MTVQLYKATQYHYQRAVMALFPLAPDQTITQMWSEEKTAEKFKRDTEKLININLE